DVQGASTSFTSTLNVADAALSVTGVPGSIQAGAPFSGPVATFTDANPSGDAGDFTAVIDWGDRTTAEGTVAAPAGGGVGVTGEHAYEQGGSYTATVTVTDADGASGTATSTFTVAAVAAVQQQPFSGVVAELTPAAGTAPSAYTAVIAWGDGTTSAGT